MTITQQFLVYQSEDGSARMDVLLEAQTLLLSHIWMHWPRQQGGRK